MKNGELSEPSAVARRLAGFSFFIPHSSFDILHFGFRWQVRRIFRPAS
jgi:hypothetical protein